MGLCVHCRAIVLSVGVLRFSIEALWGFVFSVDVL